MGPGAMSHPHGDGEGLLQAGAHHAVRNLDGLGAIELKHLVAVVPVVSGQPYRPVGRAAWCRQKLYSAGAGSLKKQSKSRKAIRLCTWIYQKTFDPDDTTDKKHFRWSRYLPHSLCSDFSE